MTCSRLLRASLAVLWSGSGWSRLSSLTSLRESHGLSWCRLLMHSRHWSEGLVLSSAVTGKASLSNLWKSTVTCTEIREVWSTAEVAVGNPARKSASVGPSVVVRRAGCHLLFARQFLGDERVPGEHMAPIKKYCTPLPWQCKRLRSWWDVVTDVASLPATKQDGMEKATLQLSTYVPTHTASSSPLTRKFPSQGSYSISVSYF